MSSATAMDDIDRDEIVENVKQYLSNLQQTIKNQMARSPKGLPACYVKNTFWVYPNDQHHAYFELRRQQQLDPRQLYKPRVFLWLPHLLETVKCPDCKEKLDSHGWPTTSAARKVVDITDNFYIMSYRYRCVPCKKTYMGSDESVVALLPPELAEEFPAYLSHRSGVSLQVMRLMCSTFASGMGPEPFMRMLYELHNRRHDGLELQYVKKREHVKHVEKQVASQKNQRSLLSMMNKQASEVTFSSFDDATGYCGFVPSAKYLTSLYNEYVEKCSADHDQYTSSLSADVVHVDHSHKVSITVLIYMIIKNVYILELCRCQRIWESLME